MSQRVEIQKWFGALISQPLQEDHKIAAQTPFGTDVKQEAKKYIAPSPTLAPFQRIELYHQQYWWRLLNCLQENFPLLARLYGYTNFNQSIGVPYLTAHPPNHWGLFQLGQTLPNWLREERFSDLDCDAASIDAAAQRAFWVGGAEPVDFTTLSEKEILSKKLTLQPHVKLFKLGGDLFTFRTTVLKEEVGYWEDNPFPEVKEGHSYFVLYRNLENEVRWKELSFGEFRLLSYFNQGTTIQKACEKLEQKGGKACAEAEELLPLWFREWTFLKWFQEV
ncbi:MAG: hypothetical protein S4CHLAM2_11730 [Chlamydiales bacterium]|nr:hypothetical protein [Chlamydiales bacterium]